MMQRVAVADKQFPIIIYSVRLPIFIASSLRVLIKRSLRLLWQHESHLVYLKKFYIYGSDSVVVHFLCSLLHEHGSTSFSTCSHVHERPVVCWLVCEISLFNPCLGILQRSGAPMCNIKRVHWSVSLCLTVIFGRVRLDVGRNITVGMLYTFR